ncbi:hypothetical protein BBJ28_00012884 [Nothophytophthora sp. Chile5]|nr:hypothetical protein BBJ28_00012884 [Nothophytophthora sp. Chile5]
MNANGSINRAETRALRPPRAPAPPSYANLQRLSEPQRESPPLTLRRAAGVGLLLFCLATAIGLVHVIGISHQVLAKLEQQQQPYPMQHTSQQSQGDWERVKLDGNGANVLVVYSDGPHLSKLAAAVGIGARRVLGNETTTLRIRTLANASFAEDVLWADAVILGSHVVNANVEPKVMTEFLGAWSFSADLSHKLGAVFVTSGGLSAGEELTMVNLLHSLMIFRMIIVGGERWTSAFGASAIVGEGPFQPAARTSPTHRDFPSICYPTDPDSIHDMFKDKAIGLGERVASVAMLLRRAWRD